MAAKYERIADDLRQQIRSQKLTPGQQMPAQTALAEQYRVSLPTVQQALSVLEAEGLIDSVHGIGTYVRVPRRRVRRTAERYQWEKTRALQPQEQRGETGSIEYDTGLSMGDLDFHSEYRTEDATAELAAALGVEPGTKLLHRIYRTMVRDERVAVSLIDSYLVYDMAAANPDLLDSANEPWPGGTHHQLRTIGIESTTASLTKSQHGHRKAMRPSCLVSGQASRSWCSDKHQSTQKIALSRFLT